MNKTKNSQAGNGILIVLLVVMLVAAIAAAGWLVYKKQNDKKDADGYTSSNSSETPTDTDKKTGSSLSTTSPTAYVNVIQDDDSVTQKKPEEVAKTADQLAILKVLHATCTNKYTYLTVNRVVFDGAPNYIQDGNYAKINIGVCDDLIKEPVGGSAAHYLHKNSAGTWVLDLGTQMLADCKKVDGLGYPKSVIETCLDGETERAPK